MHASGLSWLPLLRGPALDSMSTPLARVCQLRKPVTRLLQYRSRSAGLVVIPIRQAMLSLLVSSCFASTGPHSCGLAEARLHASRAVRKGTSPCWTTNLESGFFLMSCRTASSAAGRRVYFHQAEARARVAGPRAESPDELGVCRPGPPPATSNPVLGAGQPDRPQEEGVRDTTRTSWTWMPIGSPSM